MVIVVIAVVVVAGWYYTRPPSPPKEDVYVHQTLWTLTGPCGSNVTWFHSPGQANSSTWGTFGEGETIQVPFRFIGANMSATEECWLDAVNTTTVGFSAPGWNITDTGFTINAETGGQVPVMAPNHAFSGTLALVLYFGWAGHYGS